MPSSTTRLVLPYPVAADANNVPADLLALATRLDAVPGVESLTTTQRDALAAPQKWTGRLIWNTTTARYELWNGSTWERMVPASGIKVRLAHAFHLPGDIKVPVGDSDFVNPYPVSVPTGLSATLTRVRSKINSGTSATFKVQRNGVDVTGYTALTAGTTLATTDAGDVVLSDADLLVPVVTAVSGSPKNGVIVIEIEYGLA